MTRSLPCTATSPWRHLQILPNATNAIVTYCEGFHTSPLRGTCRDDIRPGLRITNFKGRAVIAFDVSDATVAIIGVFYGGQDYESALRPTDWDISE